MTSKKSRLLILFIFFVGLWSLLVFRAAWIQLIPNARLEAMKRRQFETTVTIGHRRGDILDRNSNELAASSAAWSLFVDPKVLGEPRKSARRIAAVLHPSRRTYEQIRIANSIYEQVRNKKRRFVWIRRQLSLREKLAIQDLKIKGIGFIEEPKRVYPNETLMANVLGFVGKEGRGLEGLEHRFNESLSASRRKVALQKDARGRPLILNGQVFTEAPDGATVQLTIDRDLQFFVERELANAVTKHEAAAATAIVLDAQTSEILAMATLPTFNANEGSKARPENRRNRTITDLFEPGSTMKTFVIAEALEKEKIQPNTKIFAENGLMKIGKRTIREADAKHHFGWITATEILSHSSNVGSTKVALLLGDRDVRAAYLRFGFGETTGVDLPGEARGKVHALPWGDHLLANISFGHGVSTTALQIANAYAAIANGGWLKRPYIVKSVLDPESGQTIESKPKILRRVLGDETASKMRLMLSATTIGEGTGFNARVPGFPVAGKTGTAQRVLEDGRGYEPGAYVSSFVGFLPANDPKFVIFVSLDRPLKNFYGGAVAAPVFSQIGRYAVSRAGLSPVLISAKNVIASDAALKARNPKADAVEWRAERGLASDELRSQGLATMAGLNMSSSISDIRRVAGVRDFFASERGAIEDGSIADGDSNSDADAHSDGRPRVPDVVGLSLREAMESFSAVGIGWSNISPRGQGFVVRQTPEPGSLWVEGKSRGVRLDLTLQR